MAGPGAPYFGEELMDWLACPLDKPCPLDWCQAFWVLVAGSIAYACGYLHGKRRRGGRASAGPSTISEKI